MFLYKPIEAGGISGARSRYTFACAGLVTTTAFRTTHITVRSQDWRFTMKSLMQAIAVAAVLSVPTVSFAQSDASAAKNNAAVSGYGGVADDTSASGSHHPLLALDHSIHSMG